MARIQITDLPLLEDLTPEQLQELFGAGRVRPVFEQLEDRLVRSGMSFSNALTLTAPVNNMDMHAAHHAAMQFVDVTAQSPGVLGIPTTRTEPASHFGSAAYEHRPEFNVFSNPITAKWVSMPDSTPTYPVGNAVGPEQSAPDGIGRYQDYEGGTIYWSKNTGAHWVQHIILDKWNFNTNGYPINDTTVNADGSRFNNFERGTISWSPGSGIQMPKADTGDFSNTLFSMRNSYPSDYPSDYELRIQQPYQNPGQPLLYTALWRHVQDGPSTLVTAKIITADGNVLIQVSSNTGTVFQGTITGQPGHYHIAGNAFTQGGVTAVIGDQVTTFHAFSGAQDQMDSGALPADSGTLPSDQLAALAAVGDQTPAANPVDMLGFETQPADPSAMALSLADSGLAAAPLTLPQDFGTQLSEPVSSALLPADPGSATSLPVDAAIPAQAPSDDLVPAASTSIQSLQAAPLDSVTLQSQASVNAGLQQAMTSDTLQASSPWTSLGAAPQAPQAPQDTWFTLRSDTVQLAPKTRAVAGESDTLQLESKAGQAIGAYLTLPKLDSNPGAGTKTIFLDFLGGTLDQDFQYKVPASTTGGTADAIRNSGGDANLRGLDVPTFDLDGKPSSFSATEQAVIKEIWQRVAEDFAPFDVNVTTNWTGALNDRNMLRVVMGGRSVRAEGTADPFGLSQFDAMKQGGPNVAFVFADTIKELDGHFATLAANVASREAGHAFGLQYQTRGDVVPVTDIMGTHIGGELSRWAQGQVPVATAAAPHGEQDDLKILVLALGRRADDNGDYQGAKDLGRLDAGGTLQAKGVIGIPFVVRSVEDPGPEPRITHSFGFQTGGGKIQIAVNGVGAGQDLAPRFEVWNTLTQVADSPVTSDINVGMTLKLTAGQYWVRVMGGVGFEYGNLGQYTLSITSIAPDFVTLRAQLTDPYRVSGMEGVAPQGFALSDAGAWPGQAQEAVPGYHAVHYAPDSGVPLTSADYGSAFDHEMQAVEGLRLTRTPRDHASPPSAYWDSDLAFLFETPYAHDIGALPQYTPGPPRPTVLADVASTNQMADFTGVMDGLAMTGPGDVTDAVIGDQTQAAATAPALTQMDGRSPIPVVGDQDQPVDAGLLQPGPVPLLADPGIPATPSTLPTDSAPFDQVALPADPGILPVPSTLLAADSATLATDQVAPVLLPADPGFAAQVQTATVEVTLDQPV